jgi:high-affinity iron transporter
MLGSFIIVLREVIEAGLIVGIVMAATRGVAGRGRWIALGVVGGLFGAGIVALFAAAISDAFEGSGQELLNAAVLLIAVAMLAWHNAWMAKHGRELAQQVRRVGRSVAVGEQPLTALAVVCGIAVLREGSEVVLFLYGVAAAGATGVNLLAGGALGVLAGAAIAAVSYLGLIAIPQRYIFAVTGVLITLLAAGMAAQAVFYLDQAGYLTALEGTAWDSSAILPQGSPVGILLHTLVGYSERPSEMQVLAYLATILGMAALARYASHPRRAVVLGGLGRPRPRVPYGR